MKVSVLMMTYNQAAYIGRAIESAVRQETTHPYEIVVGDDLSTDGTRDIVDRLGKAHPDRVRVLPTDQHLGMHKNFYRCYQACRGEYLAFLEGDDYWISPHKLQRQIDFLDSHPECSLCFHNALVVYADGSQREHLFCRPEQKAMSGMEDILAENFVPTCTAVYRNHVIEQFPTWAAELLFGDWPLNIAYAYKGPIAYLNETMAVYTKHSGGLWTGADNETKIRTIKDMYTRFNELLEFKYDSLIRILIPRWTEHFELMEVRKRWTEAQVKQQQAMDEMKASHAKAIQALEDQVRSLTAEKVAARRAPTEPRGGPANPRVAAAGGNGPRQEPAKVPAQARAAAAPKPAAPPKSAAAPTPEASKAAATASATAPTPAPQAAVANAARPRPALCAHPIFVVGSPRSGTHGLAYALGQHSQLWTHGESELLFALFGHDPVGQIYQELEKRPVPGWLTTYGVEKTELLGFLGLGINTLFTSRNPGKRWIDKTPNYVLIADMLAAMFPGARFLNILRDGRRVVHSMMHFLDRFKPEQRQWMTKNGQVPPWILKFPVACQTWRRFTEVGVDFAARHPDRCLNVRYEQLAADPARAFRAVCTFLEVPYEENIVQFFRDVRINSSFRAPGVELPTQEDMVRLTKDGDISHVRFFVDQAPYRETQPWKEWTPEQAATFVQEAGATLVQHGFATEEELDRWQQQARFTMPATSTAPVQAEPPKETEDEEHDPLLPHLQAAVAKTLPADATVLVFSYGDDSYLDLAGRRGWHFPQSETGDHEDNPSDSAEAIAHLESLRARGASHLMFPHPGLWWLEHYDDFRQHVESRYRRAWDDQHCVIFDLTSN
jgi:glycosyltransferase involved in cell wall biosynthesis